MSVIYGPDGKPITKQKDVPVDLIAVHETDMATENGRMGVAKQVMEWQMSKVRERAGLFDLMVNHDSRITLEASDDHGDRQVLFDGKPVKMKIHKDVAKQYGWSDPTDFKIPHYQEDL